MRNLRLRTRYALALVAFFCVMVILGALPGEADALSARFGDKLLHASAFGFMTALAHHSVIGPRNLRALASVSFVAMLGLVDEGIQYFLPYRNASLLDWCFDVSAALVIASLLCLRRQPVPETH